MMRASTWCAAAMLVLGCDTGEEPIRGTGTGADPIPYAPAKKTPREPVEAPRPESISFDLSDALAEPAEEPERDLSAELNAAIGTPIECLRDFSARSPTKLRISVTATVRPTGMIIMPSAYGFGLSSKARECIERRVGTVVLKTLDEPVSQSVSTIVELDYEPPVIVEAGRGVPEPQLKNVREPLPKRPEVAPSGVPIHAPPAKLISGGFDGGTPIQKPTSKKITGPKPRSIDGYEVDENAQQWSD